MLSPDRFRTVKAYGETEIIIQKSRFITYVERVDTEEEASRFIQGIAKKHWDATHNCYGYIVYDPSEIQRSSDDGEPAGTAGRPILEVIKNRQLRNTAIVVTRYFGGVKLGAAGLIRAYSQGASAGLDAAGEVDWVLHRQVHILVDYPTMGKVEHQLRQTGYEMDSPVFTDRVQWSVWVPAGREAPVQDMVAELTSGQGMITLGELDYRPRNGNGVE
ncbi:YigZ family protein [Desmospora profundinema]|uniref:YigZ family protein n=1 Tax=Desmospora profundinema TaxID=1571184 RepID=A0ABU1ILA5_9BACL|nr:YigZ family protein [Desmospora profundinema]MDR6225560.1 putative YigZ family protein [Desmospora profundinema]